MGDAAKPIMDEIREIIRDLGKGQREVQESQKKTEAGLQEFQRKTEESQKKTEAGLQEFQRKTEESQRKTEESQRKTEKSLRESQRKTEAGLQEFQRKTEESQRKTEESQRKTEKSIQKTQESINKSEGNFNNKWGAFMESLISGDLVKLLNERKISVVKTSPRIRSWRPDGTVTSEFDIVASNGEEVVVVEVKTTPTHEDINYFIKKLEKFKEVFKEYKDKKIYGAVAYLDDSKVENLPIYMEKRGLFVIQALGGGNISAITNSADFVPKSF